VRQGRRCKAATARATVSGDSTPQILATARKAWEGAESWRIETIHTASQEICSPLTLSSHCDGQEKLK
jgi:hypothetical protein